MPSPEEVFYGASNIQPSESFTADTIDQFSSKHRYQIIRQSLDDEPMQKRTLICELGCGSGDKLIWLAKKYAFSSYLGIDLCLAQSSQNEFGELIAANLNTTWPLQDSCCDALIAMMVIEHLFDPWFSFKEIARVLAPEGRAFVNLPLVTSIKNRLRLLSGRLPITSVPYRRWHEEGHWDGFHLHYFNLASIHDLAVSAGLRVQCISAVGHARRLKNIFPGILCDEISIELRKSRD